MRQTIDYGIDLGTTNSCIAVFDSGKPQVIRHGVNDYMPSAVHRRKLKEGSLTRVGKEARDLLPLQESWGIEESGAEVDGPVALEFKRRMGERAWMHRFSRGGGQVSAVDLSTAVLSEMLREAVQWKKESIKAAVVTCPACFLQPQWDATRDAAEAAGLTHVELLEEPVAASMAYGMEAKATKTARWLVFDLGGGTFDCAMVGLENGLLRTFDHDGDNRLGGKDVDIAIVNQYLLPALPEKIRKGVVPDRSCSWWKLRFAAEDAKIRLSKSDKVFVVVEGFPQDPAYTLEYELDQEKLFAIESQVVDKAILVSRGLLSKHASEISRLERILLVGGPTLSPFLQERVGKQLGIPVDTSLDPMTAVAVGASFYARSRKLPQTAPLKGQPFTSGTGQFAIQVNYPAMTPDKTPLITGKLLVSPAKGWQVELTCEASAWKSGRLTLGENGAFQVRASLLEGENTVNIQVFDPGGKQVESSVSSFPVLVHLAAPSANTRSRGLGVVTADHRIEWFFKAGESTPLGVVEKTVQFLTTKKLMAKEKGNIIRIPIVEGLHQKPHLNREIGAINIASDSIERDLPAGSVIAVTISWDSSNKETKGHAWVDYLSKEFLGKVETDMDLEAPSLKKELEEVKRAVELLGRIKDEDEGVAKSLAELREKGTLEEAARLVEQGQTNPDDLQRAEDEIAAAKVTVDPAWQTAESQGLWKWSEVRAQCEENIETAERLMSRATREQKARLEKGFLDLLAAYRAAAQRKDAAEAEDIAFGRIPQYLVSAGLAEGVARDDAGAALDGQARGIFQRQSDVKKL